MKQISVDNGHSYITPVEAFKQDQIAFDVMVHYMDDDTRERVHNELAPCTELGFLTRYLELATEDLVIG